MSDELSPEIQDAIDSVWSQYMLMMSVYGKRRVIDLLKAIHPASKEAEKVRVALLPKLEKVELK